MSQDLDIYIPLSVYLDEEIWPTDLFGSLQGGFLDGIAFEGGWWSTDDVIKRRFGYLLLRVALEQSFSLPFGLALVFGAAPFSVTFDETADGFRVAVVGDLLALRLPRAIFVPALQQDDGSFAPDPDSGSFVEVPLPVGITVDDTGRVVFGFNGDGADTSVSLFSSDSDIDVEAVAGDGDDDAREPFTLQLEPSRFFLGNTGISVEIDDFVFHLSDDEVLPDEAFAAGLDDSFRGLFIGEAAIFLPPDLASALPEALVVTNAFIGTGGFSGTVSFDKSVSGSLAGADFVAESLDVVFVQSALTKFELKGSLRLPLFDDFVDVVVGVDLDGKISVQVSQEGGLIVLEKANVFKFTVDQIELDLQGGVLTAHTSGTLTPTYQPAGVHIDWPGIRIGDLSIDSQGHVHVAGGWIDLPDQVTLSLFGFTLEITRIGFGRTDDGLENWIGFNGALRIMEGIAAGASVEGLRILWNDQGTVSLTLEGVGVDLVIPGVFEMHGKVSLTGTELAGAVLVNLIPISLELQGQFVTGTAEDTGARSYGVFFDMELPVGIPLGPTGLAMYGVSGLFAHNREPNKDDGEGWYRNPDFSDGWFTKGNPGVLPIDTKWRPKTGHLGFGAGLTFGTAADNGYMFNGRVLVVLIFPGPVILLEGMANLFKRRSSLLSAEPLFHALMVIDPDKSVTVGLDAQYKFASGGELLDIRGSAEAFFDFVSPGDWQINLGIRDPAERRLRARAFQMFDVNAFFMLSEKQLAIGGGWSYEKTWGFRHLHVSLSASLFGEAVVSWQPNHFTGDIGVSGSAGLEAFGIGIGVGVSATISGNVFQPFGLSGEFDVGIDLPWPLPDVSASITLSWSQSLDVAPPRPVPLREASIEHPKSRNTWPIPRGHSLRSDDGGGQFDFERPGGLPPPVVPDDVFPPFTADLQAPRVPADTKVGLTFTRPVNDRSLIGNANAAQVDAEIVGDRTKGRGAYTMQFDLVSIALQRWAPTPAASPAGFGWTTIESAGPDNTTTSADRLIGAWQPGTENPDLANSQQNKLLVNAVTPFDYTVDRSQSWTTWFTGAHPGYPCPLIDPRLSARFTQPIGTDFNPSPYASSIPHFVVSWLYGGDILANDAVVDSVLGPALGPIDRGLRLQEDVAVVPPPGATEVLLSFGSPSPALARASSFGSSPPTQPNPFDIADVTIRSFDGLGAARTPRAANTVVAIGGDDDDQALQVGDWVQLEPHFAAVFLEVELLVAGGFGSGIEVVVVKPDGSEGTPQPAPIGPSTIRVHQPIGMLVIRRADAGAGQALLRRITSRPPVKATVSFRSGPPAEVVEQDGRVTIGGPTGAAISSIALDAGTDFLLLEMALPSSAEAISKSTQDALTELTKEDPLFEPENDYRLVITTKRDDQGTTGDAGQDAVLTGPTTWVDHAYFHVVGPPGVGTPDQPPQSQPGPTGFEDLRIYIEQTVPPTIPEDGGKLLLPRAFYRAYDVAVKFNESYVELMYLRARRDLTVRLFDADRRPVRRPDGRVAIPTPSWERSRQQTVKEHVALWIGMVNQGPCRPDNLPPFLQGQVLKPQILSGRDDVLLAPELLHQARLVPALVHETFVGSLPGLVADGEGHRLERWAADNLGGAPSHWEVQPDDSSGAQVFFVGETNGVRSSLAYGGALGSVGANGHDAPTAWTDVRARALLRWSAGVVGIEVRRFSGDNLLRVTLDRGSGARQLVALAPGNPPQVTVLASDFTTTFPQPETDVEIVVECVGNRVRVFQDGDGVGATPIFDVANAPAGAGTVGLFVDGAASSRFAEIRVDDLRDTPPVSVAFAFDFVTSKYANFFHHMHGHDDHLFDGAPATPLTATDLAGRVGRSIAVPGTGQGAAAAGLGAVPDAERRAYEELEAIALGPEALRAPARVEITRVSGAGQPLALLLRSPEPLLWERTLASAGLSAQLLALPVPGDVMLTDVAFAAAPAGESVTILVRAAVDLSGHSLEWRPLPSASDPDPAWAVYFAFDAEAPFPDGRQIQIVATDATDAPPPDAGVTQRFVAATAADAAVHFASPGAELRLLAPDGTVVHRRPFPSPEAFVPLALRALRKLDGTAALLFVDPATGAGVGAPPATLRLRLTFARAAGDEDLRMRQDGSEQPEVVNLDVPLALPA
jgi:hypothetical protein